MWDPQIWQCATIFLSLSELFFFLSLSLLHIVILYSSSFFLFLFLFLFLLHATTLSSSSLYLLIYVSSFSLARCLLQNFFSSFSLARYLQLSLSSVFRFGLLGYFMGFVNWNFVNYFKFLLQICVLVCLTWKEKDVGREEVLNFGWFGWSFIDFWFVGSFNPKRERGMANFKMWEFLSG